MDELRQEFRKDHAERHELWAQWKQVVDEISNKDQTIEKMQDELVQLEEDFKERDRYIEQLQDGKVNQEK